MCKCNSCAEYTDCEYLPLVSRADVEPAGDRVAERSSGRPAASLCGRQIPLVTNLAAEKQFICSLFSLVQLETKST